MINSTTGSLTLVNANTSIPEVYWNGKRLAEILSVRVDCDSDEHRVKLRVVRMDEDLYTELTSAGILIKRER